MVLDVPHLPVWSYTDWTVFRMGDGFHDRFFTHVSNDLRYIDEAGVVC